MIVYIIGGYCIISACVGIVAILASVIGKDVVAEGAMIRAQFLIATELAVAAWCFK